MNTRDRKVEESRFHDLLRSPELREDPRRFRRLTANKKYYAVTRQSRAFFEDWIVAHAPGRMMLDVGCGDGAHAILAAQHGAEVVGIDISQVSVENAIREAELRGVRDRVSFQVMDAEALEFADNSFDAVYESGALHHLDLAITMQEIARVLKPDGKVLCAEALGHNPAFQLYRRATPHLRTRWETEHILRKHDVLGVLRWFRDIDLRFFHLAALAGVPFRSTPAFGHVLSVLERLDGMLLRVPGVQWYAWQVILLLSRPRKPMLTSRST